jgi:phenylpyruvate tautomerase PptA (4-oxalocrotonate tautomerase family)
MPIVHVHVRAGRDAREKQAILDGVHAALVEAFRIPEHDRNQILHEHAPEHFESGKGPGWGIRGGKAATDVAIGFALDV